MTRVKHGDAAAFQRRPAKRTANGRRALLHLASGTVSGYGSVTETALTGRGREEWFRCEMQR